MSKIVNDGPAILLAHEPDIFPHVSNRFSLTLAGHTHGGQIRLFGRPIHVPSRYGRRYLQGHIVEDNRHLIVSAGVGISDIPLRAGVPPKLSWYALGMRSAGTERASGAPLRSINGSTVEMWH